MQVSHWDPIPDVACWVAGHWGGVEFRRQPQSDTWHQPLQSRLITVNGNLVDKYCETSNEHGASNRQSETAWSNSPQTEKLSVWLDLLAPFSKEGSSNGISEHAEPTLPVLFHRNAQHASLASKQLKPSKIWSYNSTTTRLIWPHLEWDPPGPGCVAIEQPNDICNNAFCLAEQCLRLI
jgi:hypothetical protein